MGSDWWLKRPAYFLVMMRELTSVFIGAYLLLFLWFLYVVGQGQAAYEAHLNFLASPGMILFHLVTLAASLLHTITWFNLTPKAMVVRIGEDKLPAVMITAPNYVIWIALSAAILWAVQA